MFKGGVFSLNDLSKMPIGDTDLQDDSIDVDFPKTVTEYNLLEFSSELIRQLLNMNQI